MGRNQSNKNIPFTENKGISTSIFLLLIILCINIFTLQSILMDYTK